MASSPTSANILIRIAPGTVWKTWCNLDQWQKWQPETVEVFWLNNAIPWQTGAEFSLLRKLPFPVLGGNRRFIGKVLSVAEEQLLVWELRPTRAGWFGPTIVQSVRLSPAPGGTTVFLSLTLHGLGPSLMRPFLGGALQRQIQESLEGLRYELQPITRGR